MTQLKPEERTIPEPVLEALWELWGKMGRQPRMRMVSGSMQPLIKEGDELHIEPQPKVIHLGEVLIYRHRKNFNCENFFEKIVQRIHGINGLLIRNIIWSKCRNDHDKNPFIPLIRCTRY